MNIGLIDVDGHNFPNFALMRTSAGDNGAINVWKDDAGIIRGKLMRYCVTVEKRTFANYVDAEKCVSDWLERID